MSRLSADAERYTLIVGCGRLGSSIVEGWLQHGPVDPRRLAIQTPTARPLASSSNDAPSNARLAGTSSAAPTPCSARAMISNVRSGAAPHSAEAAENSTTPTTNTRRRP